MIGSSHLNFHKSVKVMQKKIKVMQYLRTSGYACSLKYTHNSMSWFSISYMMTSWHRNESHITGPLWRESSSWLVGLDLFNDNTYPSGHISHPTQVNVSQSCFNSLNILLKLNYIVQVWGLVEVNCVISDRRIPLPAGIPLCKSRELSRRGYSMNQLCSIHHDIPVTLHTPGAYGQWSVFDHNGDK